LNLVTNSIQALESMDRNHERWVRLRVDHTDENIFIKVIDSGRPISPDIEKKLMQPFFTTKAVGVGTGLGLSISFGIVQSHGGHLYLDRSLSNTCFTVQLPIKKSLAGDQSYSRVS